MIAKRELLALLGPMGQSHLLSFWDELDDAGRERLAGQIAALDLPLVRDLYAGDESAPDWAALAERADSPPAIRLGDRHDRFAAEDAVRRGAEALSAGQVGMILVAGGQGSRLGFDHPKGMFAIGPVSGRTLFAVLIDRLRAVSRRYRRSIPLYLMTSPATDQETRACFAAQQNFGLADDEVHFFCQGVMPAVDAESGQLLLAERDGLALSPDGHGGMLAALHRSGCLEDARRRGIESLFYGQVDNPLLQVCDPHFLGCHLLAASEMTTQVVNKTSPRDRVGNVVRVDGQTQIIEYSDLPDHVAEQRDEQGALRLWAGSIAVHVFARSFLERAADQAQSLPFHRARKKMPYLDATGRLVTPERPNAVKFERFIFDLLPAAANALVVEVDAADAFAPVKNADGGGTETPRDSRIAMVRRDAALLRRAGVEVSDGVDVEVNPLWALDAEEAARKLEAGMTITEPRYFA